MRPLRTIALLVFFISLPLFSFSQTPSGTHSTISSNFNGTAISAGKYVWYSAVFSPQHVGSGPAHIYLRNATVTFAANGTNYTLAVPDADILISSSITTATSSYDAAANKWTISTPPNLAGNTLLTAFSFPVPSAGLPGGINPVTFGGYFFTDTQGVSLNWQWAAAVYTSFNANWNLLGVKPIDATTGSPYNNSDHAGTPENYKSDLTSGARGGGGSNYTGGYSGTASVTPVVQVPNTTPPSITASISPSPNAVGWNTATTTVSFNCAAGTNPIASCTG